MDLELYKIELQREVSADLFQVLSQEEQRFAQMMHNEVLKKQYITVRIGLRQILALYLNKTCDAITIVKTEYGKPYLIDYPNCHFNISHSGDFLLIAISQLGAVGIDIEQIKSYSRDFSALVAKCFATSEQHYWHNLADNEKVAEFYRFWTRKEAFVKAVGRGLAMGLQSCVIASEKPPRFMGLPQEYGRPSDWRLFDLSLNSGLYGALVLENGKIPVNFRIPEITLFEIRNNLTWF